MPVKFLQKRSEAKDVRAFWEAAEARAKATNEHMREVAASSQLGQEFDQEISTRTWTSRWQRSLTRIASLVSENKKPKLTLCIIGVGRLSGPQVREAIRSLKDACKKEIEVSVVDINEQLLSDTLQRAREEFVGTAITPHLLDITAPTSCPLKQADILVSTNVLANVAPPYKHKPIGMWHIASLMQKAGYLLVSSGDVRLWSRVGEDQCIQMIETQFGLRQVGGSIDELTSGSETLPGRSVIFQKVGESWPFHEIWSEAKKQTATAHR